MATRAKAPLAAPTSGRASLARVAVCNDQSTQLSFNGYTL